MTLILAFSRQALAQDSFKSYKAITRVKNQITVGVFPQVELISIVQTISKYPTVLGFLMEMDSSTYKADVINQFHPYKDHPAVLMFDRLSLQPRMLNYSAPSNIMLYTDESLRLRKDIEFDDFVISRAGGIDSLKVFLNLLRDFAIQSSFDEFFQVQREIYNTMGPMTVKNNVPFFGDENYFKYMIRHEFSHPFINPLTEKNWDYIKDYSARYDSIPDVARQKVCGDWQECINEFIIRAITTQIAFDEAEEIGLLVYEREKSKGVSYLDNLLEKIRFYQSNRETYPTLESYYLHLLDVFKEE